MKTYEDLTGRKFGRLTVIDLQRTDGRIYWKCKCDCGNIKLIPRGSLVSGRTRSCGCYNRERAVETNTTHGMTETRLYQTWQNMKNRCRNKNVESYKYYGERGISLCDEWNESFKSFAKWSMENGYAEELSIDRIDPNIGYEPSNCRWVDSVTQANNKRTNHLLTYNGETKTVAEWARETGLSYKVLYRRLCLGWTAERALTTPKSADKWHKS